MPSTNVNLFRANIGIYNNLLTSFFTVYAPNTLPSVQSLALAAKQRTDITPITLGQNFGQKYTFEINQQLPEIESILVNATFSPLTYNGTYCYYAENFVQQLIQLIEFRDPANGQIQTYSPEVSIADYRDMKITEQAHYARQFLLGLPIATRAGFCANGVSTTFELPSWLRERYENTMRAQNLDVPLLIDLTLAPLNTLINTDSTLPVTGTITLTMTFMGRIPTEAERNTTAAVINSKDGQLMQIADGFYQSYQTIPAGFSGSITFPIDAIKGPVYSLVLFFRAQNDVQGSGLTPVQNEYTNFLQSYKPDNIEIKSGNEFILQNIQTTRLTRDDRRFFYPSSMPTSDLVYITFAEFPELCKKLNSTYLDFNFIGKAQMTVFYQNPTAVAINVGILARTNIFITHQAGTIKAVTSQ